MLGDVCQCGLDILFERERRFSYEFSFFLLRRVYKKSEKKSEKPENFRPSEPKTDNSFLLDRGVGRIQVDAPFSRPPPHPPHLSAHLRVLSFAQQSEKISSESSWTDTINMGTAAAAAAEPGGASPHSITAKSQPAAVAALAAAIVPSWAGLAPSSLDVGVISGGITNALWSVAVVDDPEVSPRAVAVRAYGDGTELLVDRALEIATLLELNARGFGARVVAAFESGRVEEFLPGRALTPDDAAQPETAERIARGLARLHAVDLKRKKREKEKKGTKKRFSFFPSRSSTSSSSSSFCCLFSVLSRRPQKTSHSERDSALFSTIRDWVALADRLDGEAGAEAAAEGGEKAETEPRRAPPPPPSVGSDELLAEVALLEERVRASCRPSSPSSSPSPSSCPELSRVVFCHMDLLPGNIMTTDDLEEEGGAESRRSPAAAAAAAAADDEEEEEEEEEREVETLGPGRNLQFIDFEYGRLSHAGFDVGNHWCEYAGLDCDWARYPTVEQRRAFARAYLSEAEAISSRASRRRRSSSSSSSSAAALSLSPPSEERVSAFVAQAELFSLAAHLFWTAWAKVQARVSPIDFDYGSYARSRFEDFRRRKGTAFAASR